MFWLLHLPCLWQCNVHAQSVMVTCLVLSFLNILYHDANMTLNKEYQTISISMTSYALHVNGIQFYF